MATDYLCKSVKNERQKRKVQVTAKNAEYFAKDAKQLSGLCVAFCLCVLCGYFLLIIIFIEIFCGSSSVGSPPTGGSQAKGL